LHENEQINEGKQQFAIEGFGLACLAAVLFNSSR